MMTDCPYCDYRGEVVYYHDHREEATFAICPRCGRAHEVRS